MSNQGKQLIVLASYCAMVIAITESMLVGTLFKIGVIIILTVVTVIFYWLFDKK